MIKRRLTTGLRRYASFFLLMVFIITCCMRLFLEQLQNAMGITYHSGNIGLAALYTFGNVIFLSFLCTVVDAIRRKIMIDRPVKEITYAAEKIMKGDFSVRIELSHMSYRFDVSEGFHEIADYFNQMAEELSGVETLRTDFIANVSHELKTPLALIQNYAVMLEQPGLQEECRMEYAHAVTDTCKRLSDLITNILKLNKLENQQIFPELKEYDLTEQLCENLLQFENVWENKQIEIETDLEEDVHIFADEELLGLVWNNLLSNAFKFTPQEGKVSLSLKKEGDNAVVTVADTGCGISQEEGKHIFEKFYQGDTSHSSQGNGLGLSLVKRVVDILHGEIRVESRMGEGSRFTVILRRLER